MPMSASRNTTSSPTGSGRFPNQFELVPIAGAERFPVKIALGRVTRPLRPEAAKAFEEFFFGRARDVYPRYDFARMTDDEYGAVLAFD